MFVFLIFWMMTIIGLTSTWLSSFISVAELSEPQILIPGFSRGEHGGWRGENGGAPGKEREVLNLKMDLAWHAVELSPMMALSQTSRPVIPKEPNWYCFSVPTFPQLQQHESLGKSTHLQGQLFFKLQLHLQTEHFSPVGYALESKWQWIPN